MSQQGMKRSRSSTPEETQAPAKTPRHGIETVQQEQTQLVKPESARGPTQANREEIGQASDLRKYDDDGLLIIRPPPPITNWRFGVREPSPPPALTEEEREIEELWGEMEFLLQYNEDSSSEESTEEGPDVCTHDGGSTERMSGASSSSSG